MTPHELTEIRGRDKAAGHISPLGPITSRDRCALDRRLLLEALDAVSAMLVAATPIERPPESKGVKH